MVYAFDSSTISLCLSLCPWATFKEHKGGVKMHTLLDIRSQLPVFIYLTDASVHDVKVLEKLYIEPAAIYVMDKGYVEFFRLFNLIHQKRAFFVTRAKDNMVFNVVSVNQVDQQTGVVSDQYIELKGYKTSKDYPEKIRMIVYEDFATGVVYRFLTNNFELPSITISELYRERWAVELFFKWIIQHLRKKSFYGTTRNAVYSQIWIAVCTFLLIAIAKKKYHIEQSLYTFSQTLGLTLFEKMPINEIFNKNVNERI